MFNEKEARIIDIMIWEGMIPSTGLFQISEDHLDSFTRLYPSVSKTGGNNPKKTNKKFARRLAGRTLLKLLSSRGARFTDIKAGLVYMLENPSFPNHVKIGITLDLDKRLSLYQTADPFRSFSVRKYNFVLDRCRIEQNVLYNPNILKVDGEWVLKENADNIFDLLVK